MSLSSPLSPLSSGLQTAQAALNELYAQAHEVQSLKKILLDANGHKNMTDPSTLKAALEDVYAAAGKADAAKRAIDVETRLLSDYALNNYLELCKKIKQGKSTSSSALTVATRVLSSAEAPSSSSSSSSSLSPAPAKPSCSPRVLDTSSPEPRSPGVPMPHAPRGTSTPFQGEAVSLTTAALPPAAEPLPMTTSITGDRGGDSVAKADSSACVGRDERIKSCQDVSVCRNYDLAMRQEGDRSTIKLHSTDGLTIEEISNCLNYSRTLPDSRVIIVLPRRTSSMPETYTRVGVFCREALASFGPIEVVFVLPEGKISEVDVELFMKELPGAKILDESGKHSAEPKPASQSDERKAVSHSAT
jgi:hypothetical protein